MSQVSNSRGGNIASCLARIQRHHNAAYDLIKRAIDYDDDKSYALAMEYYRKGVAELQHALKCEISSPPDSDKEDNNLKRDYEKVSLLRSKMQLNLDQFTSRLKELRELCKAATDSRSLKSSGFTLTPDSKMPSTVPSKVSPLKKSSSPVSAVANDLISKHPNSTTINQRVNQLSNVEPEMAHMILNEIIDHGPVISWDSVVGLEVKAKQALDECVIYPSLKPELFTGLRAPVRGLLLFGPPGNGKTYLAKALAGVCNSTFFNISASSLTSRYVGDSEKMVKALFAVARHLQPSIIFIDEIDSVLSERKESEHEALRRLKNEFLLAWDGVASEANERIVVMGATNRPRSLDDAALRRMPKRIFVPLPDATTRLAMLTKLLSTTPHSLSSRQLQSLSELMNGYSGSDIKEVARDAAMNAVRELTQSRKNITLVEETHLRPIQYNDFKQALASIRPSVSRSSLSDMEQWNKEYGSLV